MIVYLGADHRGFQVKEGLKAFLEANGWTVQDLGASEVVADDDYVDYAKAVAEKVSADANNSRGVLVCGSGVGMDVTANKFYRVRSALAFSPDQAMAARHDDDTNVLSIPSDFVDLEMAKKILSVWMQTPFSNEELDKRRLQKLSEIDNSLN